MYGPATNSAAVPLFNSKSQRLQTILSSFVRYKCIMKYIMLLLFLALVGQGINANNKKERKSFLGNDWCVKTSEIENWVLVDKYGNLYNFTSKELYNIPDSTYEKMKKHTRVKQILFKDVEFIDDIEKD